MQKTTLTNETFIYVECVHNMWIRQGRRHRGGQGGHGPPTFCRAKILKTNFYKQNILIVNCTMGTYWHI